MNSKKLYGLIKYFLDLSKLSDFGKFPKVLMLSGKKGQGKFTLIHHLMSYIFDKENYNLTEKAIHKSNKLYKNLKDNYNPNLIYHNCAHKNVKIDDIRNLKVNLQKSSINNLNRYIIFDDVEYLNDNCINALLKTTEEPSAINYFILINNESRKILDTLKSRSIEIKIFMNNNEKADIIKKLISDFNIEEKIELEGITLTPGNYLKFNNFLLEENIEINDKLIVNIEKLLKLSKLKKDVDYLNFAIYLINQHYFIKSKNKININHYNNNRINIIRKLHESNNLNLNHVNLITEIESYI